MNFVLLPNGFTSFQLKYHEIIYNQISEIIAYSPTFIKYAIPLLSRNFKPSVFQFEVKSILIHTF